VTIDAEARVIERVAMGFFFRVFCVEIGLRYNKKVIAQGAHTERRGLCRAGEELAWR
jgi:hypothetical protein